jgi:hypothetical protein
LILAVWMGIYPAPFLHRLETSVRHIVARVSPQYEAKYAANCDPTPTPERVAALSATNSAARFLSAVPCDVNGNPLPSAAGGATGSTQSTATPVTR